MKKFLSIILSISLVVFVIWCSSNTSNSENNISSNSPQNKEVILGMTTGIEDAGLLAVIISAFEKETGYTTKTVSVGTGQALALAQKGEVDAISQLKYTQL